MKKRDMVVLHNDNISNIHYKLRLNISITCGLTGVTSLSCEQASPKQAQSKSSKIMKMNLHLYRSIFFAHKVHKTWMLSIISWKVNRKRSNLTLSVWCHNAYSHTGVSKGCLIH